MKITGVDIINMKYEDIRSKAIDTLGKIGALIPDIDSVIDEDINIQDYIFDSLQFITFIVELENMIGTEIPDELLNYENLVSLNAFCTSLELVYNEQ